MCNWTCLCTLKRHNRILHFEKRRQPGLKILSILPHFCENRPAVHGPDKRVEVIFIVSEVRIPDHLTEEGAARTHLLLALVV